MPPLWSGSISFGLVNIPVKLLSGSKSNSLDLDMLRKGDLCPVRFDKVCRSDGKVIPYENIVKGYKYKNGDYVVLTDKDFEDANVSRTKSIELLAFVKEVQIESIYYEKPYYLEPEESAFKAYAVLREALRKSKRVGIARFVIHKREHLCALKPWGNMILLNQLRYQEEIRSIEKISLPGNEGVKEKEIEMAIQLIGHLAADFKPKIYKDTYVKDLQEIIEEKAKGLKVRPRGKAPRPSKAKDLMALLKASMNASLKKAA